MPAKPTSSRLPRAFVRASRCPICAYSLTDLAPDANCPECGSEINRSLLASHEFRFAVDSTKGWCWHGILSWGFITCLLLTFGVLIKLQSNMTGRSNDMEQFLLFTIVLLIPVTATVVSIRWHVVSTRMIYKRCSRKKRSPRIPIRIVVTTLIGMLLTCTSCFVFTIVML